MAARTGVLDITVLMGGPGSEREISLLSGSAVADALRRRGHRVTQADITPQDTSPLERKGLDVVFIALHGNFGESGEVQQLCEQRRLAYVGSGPWASAQAMNKVSAKEAFRSVGLHTPDWVVVRTGVPAARRAEWLERIALPCVLKPVDGGSSVDVYIVRDRAAFEPALQRLLGVYGRALMETYISGREMTVGILDRQALPVLEIRASRDFYDYQAKYLDDTTQYLLQTHLPAEALLRLQSAGLAAHDALACRDFSRVDFILDAAGTPWVLEVNTIPGFTSHSLLPKAAAAVGIGFDELCERIVRLALERAGR